MCQVRAKVKAVTFMVIMVVTLLGTTRLLARECSDAPPGVMTMGRCCFTFTGEASGGTFMFCQYLGDRAECATVETIAGEPAEMVIERLANVIDETNPFDWGGFPLGEKLVTSSGCELKGLVGMCNPYIIAGTEVGLGIPQPPHSLT